MSRVIELVFKKDKDWKFPYSIADMKPMEDPHKDERKFRVGDIIVRKGDADREIFVTFDVGALIGDGIANYGYVISREDEMNVARYQAWDQYAAHATFKLYARDGKLAGDR